MDVTNVMYDKDTIQYNTIARDTLGVGIARRVAGGVKLEIRAFFFRVPFLVSQEKKGRNDITLRTGDFEVFFRKGREKQKVLYGVASLRSIGFNWIQFN